MTVSCIIIEDSIKQSNVNRALVKEHFSNIDQVFSLEEAKQKLNTSSYDIIIADVHLGDGLVFDALREANLKNSKLIFTTSHSEYAIEAFKFSALSYLLKPYSDNELKTEVLRTLDLIQQENYYKQIEVFFHNLQSQQQSQRIVLKNHDLTHVVDLQDIYYAQADNNYTHFFCSGNKKVLVSKSLKTFEEQLSKKQFFRCHHSYLINLNRIKALHKSADAVILDDDSTIPVASRKKKLLQELLNF
ncbi:LytR/AlgR family response regulator transcription factor [Winogradskyella flava]|uniref:Response regulator transcription factor n=1 Tax=Winogradskyella flava TaxID=1884876 RepID=A0A842ILA4_9FLAO|nr:LytTR family DNA-binding domain-containing protein [Winogradskyella flava]MBC2843740.1 response regulator transcription factor [Winogradskyella flava]